MTPYLILAFLYVAFLLWHWRWIPKPVTMEEIDHYFDVVLKDESSTPLSEEEAANARAFFQADDGKSFFLINLLQHREEAVYPEGFHSEAKTGKEADALYAKAVIKELFKRACYPIYHGRKISNLKTAGEGTDFFEEVAVVRYRSRRDLLEMTSSPAFLAAEPHKWAALEDTVVVPAKRVILLNPLLLLSLTLLLLGVLIHQF